MCFWHQIEQKHIFTKKSGNEVIVEGLAKHHTLVSSCCTQRPNRLSVRVVGKVITVSLVQMCHFFMGVINCPRFVLQSNLCFNEGLLASASHLNGSDSHCGTSLMWKC